MHRIRPKFCSRLLAAAIVLTCGAARAQEFPQPIGDPSTGSKSIGRPLRVEVTDQINPLYLKLHLTVGELEGVDSVVIVDRTARRELFRFARGDFASQIAGQSPDTEVVFAKNFTFRRAEKRPDRDIMVTLFNANNRPMRSSAFAFHIQPHPSEALTADVSFQTFSDIAQIDFQDACRGQRDRFSVERRGAGILIGELEQTFPSLGFLSQIQKKESLRGYFEGCVGAYNQCFGPRAASEAQRVQEICTTEREKLRQDVFSKQ